MAVKLGESNWLGESLKRSAEANRQKEIEQAQTKVRQRRNLIESMEFVLGQSQTNQILDANEPAPETDEIRSGRYVFRGRADACGTGFYLYCPDYKGSYGRHLESDWIDSIKDLDRAIESLSTQMQGQDEFVANRLKREAEIEKQTAPQVAPLSADDSFVISHCRSLIRVLETGDTPDQLQNVTYALILTAQAIQFQIRDMCGGEDPNPPDDYDPNDNR